MRRSHKHDSQYQRLLLAVSLQKDHVMEPGTRQSIPESLIGHQFTKRPCDGAWNKLEKIRSLKQKNLTFFVEFLAVQIQ